MTDPLNLRQLAYFLAAVDAGSMTGAAKTLRVSQSAVSQAVGELERRFGVQLLLRHRSKGLTLTSSGAELIADARALLAHADELHTQARSLGTELTGQLVVGCFSTLAPFVMPQLLEGFQLRHPGVQVQFIEGSLSDLQSLLWNGQCELALCYDVEVMPGISRELLYDTAPSVVLHPEHPLASESQISLKALSGEPLILLDVEPSYAFYQSLLTDAGVEMNVRFRAGSFEMARALVGRGFGISMLVQRAASDVTYDGARVVTRPVSDPIKGPPVVLARTADARPTRRARAFADFCLSSLPHAAQGKGATPGTAARGVPV